MTTEATSPAIGFTEAVLPNSVSQAMLRSLAYVAGERGFRVLAADAALDPERQKKDIIRLTDLGVEAMLVYPVGEPEELWPSLDYAADAGVHLFAHDELGHPAIVSTLITPVSEMGAMAASVLADALDGAGDVVVVGGVPAPAILERIAGFEAEIAKHDGLRVVAKLENRSDVEDGAQAAVSELLAAGVSFDGLFGYNDATAIGAAAAATAAGLTPVVVGNNGEPHGIEAVARGVIAATVDRHPAELALQGATAMLDLVQSRAAVGDLPSRIYGDATLITREDIKGFVPWEQRCPKPPEGSWLVV